jgi:hypothetical protein
MLDGLNEVVGSDSNPDRWVNRVHLKVVFSTSDPQLGIVAIELGEEHLG